MAGLLVPAIHVFLSDFKTWMPGTRPGMTILLLSFYPYDAIGVGMVSNDRVTCQNN
jgi:hypothetical protein